MSSTDSGYAQAEQDFLDIEEDYVNMGHTSHTYFKRILLTFTVFIAYPIRNM